MLLTPAKRHSFQTNVAHCDEMFLTPAKRFPTLKLLWPTHIENRMLFKMERMKSRSPFHHYNEQHSNMRFFPL